MTVNTVYFEGRMGCFSLLQFSNLSPPLSCSPLLSRSSPLSLSFSLLSFPFSPFSRFHSPSPFSPPFLSPILLSPVFTLLPLFPTLPLPHPSPFSRFHSPSPFSHPSYLPSFFFLPFSLSFPLFQPFLSPILLLSPPLLHLPCRPLLYTSNHVLKQPWGGECIVFSISVRPSVRFLQFITPL